MSDGNHELVDYLAEHPRMIGVLFAIMLALSQVGTVAANGASTTIGP